MSENPSALNKKLTEVHREGEERAAQKLAQESGYAYVDLRKTPVAIGAMRLIPEEEAKAAKMAGIQIKVKKLAIAAADPRIPEVGKIIKDLEGLGYEVKAFVASDSGLVQAWNLYKFIKPESEDITGKVQIEIKRVEDLTSRLKTIKTVQEEIAKFDFNQLNTADLFEVVLAGAMANRASDIHFESEEKEAKIRFRIDGTLHDVFQGLPLKNYHSLVSRIKLLSGLKINVKDEAQDGRFTIDMKKKEIEMRVSIIPAEFGETIVMRILDPESINIGLAGLGLRDDDVVLVQKQIERPNGLILNTGPTGSGKTTTLYAFLKHVNNPEIKIITVEDPIEYHLEGVEQTQVDAEAGYTFASGLRSILRQDPDIILVGEVRDLETADIAMQAALTGHLVFSTLHTNDAVGAVPRLIDLGVKVTTIGPALALIIAQRLVRKLCPHCKKEVQPSADIKEKIKNFLARLPQRVDKTKYDNYKIYEPVGCEECNNIGYRGRIAVYEFLESGAEMEKIILRDFSEVALKELAKKQEMVSMQADGLLKVLSGTTTLGEVQDITGELVW